MSWTFTNTACTNLIRIFQLSIQVWNHSLNLVFDKIYDVLYLTWWKFQIKILISIILTTKSFPPIGFDRKLTCFSGNGFSILKIWQAYLVPIRKDGRHTWSLTKLIWQACLVPFVINKASIPTPSYRLGWFTGFRFFLGTIALVCLICALIWIIILGHSKSIYV